MKTISCLWIQDALDNFSNVCISSWLTLDYNVNIYTYSNITNFKLLNKICFNEKITVLDANHIMVKPDKDILSNNLPLSDLFRFTLLSQKEECLWLDTDLFLLRKLPDGDYVSSEHSNQTGAFMTKNRKKTANIGCISQTKKTIDWDKIINKCGKSKKEQNSNANNFMKLYQKEVHDNHFDMVKEPDDFCPISWCYSKELYNEKDIIGTKYGIDQKKIAWIFQNSIGIHLWRNLFTTKKYKIEIDSVFSQIMKYHELKYKICIPSYDRVVGIQEKTLKMLKSFNITDVNIFVSTQKDFDTYTEANIGNIILVPDEFDGIGAVRSYIVNEWAVDKDNIVMIDDDIEYYKNQFCGQANISILIQDFFSNLKELGLYFGGLPLCANEFFLKDKWTRTLKYCSGATQFIRIDKSREKIHCPYRHYEDYFYNMAYFKRDGGILRYNGVAPVTKNYNVDGGIATEMGGLDKRLDCESVADDIITRFGDRIVSKYWKEKGRGPACWNLRLNWRAKPDYFKHT